MKTINKIQKFIEKIKNAQLFFENTKHFFIFLFVVSFLVSCIVYFPALGIGFLSDDWGYVYASKHFSSADAWKFLWSPDPYGVGGGNFRPLQSTLTVWSWKAINIPAVIHLRSIILHGIQSALVGILVFQLYKDRKTAIIATLLFALFPLNTEVVVWLSSWNSLLAGIPLTIATIIYVAHGSKKFLVITSLLIILSLMAKEHALVFPFIIILVDLLLKRKTSFASILYFACIDALYFLWRFAVIGGMGGYKTAEQSSTHLSISLDSLLLYAKLPFAYGYNFFNRAATPESLAWGAYAISAVLFAASILYLYKKTRFAHVRSILILGALVYVSHAIGWNLVNPLDIHNEHSRILYIATIWAVILIASLFYWTKNSRLRYIFYLYILIMFPLAHFQTGPWVVAGMVSKHIVSELDAELQTERRSETDKRLQSGTPFEKQAELPSSQKPKKITITNLPDQYKGAFIFRNGMDYVIALKTNTRRNEIPLEKTMLYEMGEFNFFKAPPTAINIEYGQANK